VTSVVKKYTTLGHYTARMENLLPTFCETWQHILSGKNKRKKTLQLGTARLYPNVGNTSPLRVKNSLKIESIICPEASVISYKLGPTTFLEEGTGAVFSNVSNNLPLLPA
jgi:hypothetical protein